MCGIFGNINKKGIDKHLSRIALNTLVHRGPDQKGEYAENSVYIGHRRLSILDLSENGKQPMESENTAITVNGEIYNFSALKSKLHQKYQFKSSSDSEVILYGYEEWGLEGLLERIDGMYAIAIYDKKKQLIHLVRDRYGIKPLYYSLKSDIFCWASELKAIKTFFSEESLRVDFTAVYDYLTYLYIPTPKTLYNDVYKLLPAHYLTYDPPNSKIHVNKYWELPVQERQISLNEAAEQVINLISKSVHAQMVSDVPVGFFLSGGIDSSIVVASASQFSNLINTYSIGFDVASHNETQYARVVADAFKTNHQEKILSIFATNKLFDKFVNWYDEPYADTSAFPSYLVSEFAKQESTVVLTGDGGDELFGGYDWYNRFYFYKQRRLPALNFLKVFASKIKQRSRYSLIGRIANQLEYRLCNDLELYAKLLGGLLKHEKKHYAKEWGIPADYNDYWYFEKYFREDLTPKKRLQYLDFHTYLPDDIFVKVDRVSMSVSLECRVPFMDRELVEFAFSLPENIIYAGGQLKAFLRYAYKDLLPDTILNRDKRGFNIPLKQWGKEFLIGNYSQQEKILGMFNLNGK